MDTNIWSDEGTEGFYRGCTLNIAPTTNGEWRVTTENYQTMQWIKEYAQTLREAQNLAIELTYKLQ